MGERRDLGPAFHVTAEALGEPGNRRFRLRTLSADGDSACFWLEKEQLNALGEAIASVLHDEDYRYERPPLDDREPDPVFPLNASVEAQVRQLSMGVNRDAEQVVIIASDGDPEDADTVTVTFGCDYRRAHELRRQIADVVAAGRKPCPLCSAPMDPAGHVCVRSNGHHPH